MKVITEERLRKLRSMLADCEHKFSMCDLLDDLIYALQEIDTLTVTKLRPMCEISDRPHVLVDNDFSRYLIEAEVDHDKQMIITRFGQEIDFSNCNGWIPVPEYKP